ncbi:MAG: OmpA family protein [Panacagrimonas sp.]
MIRLLARYIPAFVATMALSLSASVSSESEDPLESPLYRGGYIAPMVSYLIPDADRLEDGFGGTIGFGYRNRRWALEIVGYQVGLDSDGFSSSPELVGGAFNGLLFPFASLPNLYGIASVGGAQVSKYPIPANGVLNPQREEHFPLVRVGAGVGHLFPISLGRYDMAVRAEALYVAGFRDEEADAAAESGAPNDFKDVVLNVGLQLPLGLRADPPPPPVEPVVVVAPIAVCADGQDNDGDGLTDYPADPGCGAVDDPDEIDPPQCADGKDNDGDGLTDFPADKGCAAADDNEEMDPCRTPAPGEVISLKGCGTGDVIVLSGVNFEFDKSRLTANARTILDGVAAELEAYPEIEIELGGHTDAKGSDEYNQRLSEQRAASVVKYLKSKGVAADRMTSAGYGESQPVADNEADEGRELNRRVELKITGGVAASAARVAEPAPAADAAPAAETAR